eukprot:3009489-Rhodomonas_salina.2
MMIVDAEGATGRSDWQRSRAGRRGADSDSEAQARSPRYCTSTVGELESEAEPRSGALLKFTSTQWQCETLRGGAQPDSARERHASLRQPLLPSEFRIDSGSISVRVQAECRGVRVTARCDTGKQRHPSRTRRRQMQTQPPLARLRP